jgi:hypothetical protein
MRAQAGQWVNWVRFWPRPTAGVPGKSSSEAGNVYAVLCIHARPNRALPDVVARMGLGDGYLMGGLCVAPGPEPAGAAIWQELAMLAQALKRHFDSPAAFVPGSCGVFRSVRRIAVRRTRPCSWRRGINFTMTASADDARSDRASRSCV